MWFLIRSIVWIGRLLKPVPLRVGAMDRRRGKVDIPGPAFDLIVLAFETVALVKYFW
jgi:hypothetical protein